MSKNNQLRDINVSATKEMADLIGVKKELKTETQTLSKVLAKTPKTRKAKKRNKKKMHEKKKLEQKQGVVVVSIKKHKKKKKAVKRGRKQLRQLNSC